MIGLGEVTATLMVLLTISKPQGRRTLTDVIQDTNNA